MNAGGGSYDLPEVQDVSALGGNIWIGLFGCVMAASVIANVVLVALVAARRRTRRPVYLLHCVMFAVNAVDFCLLSFEFSLGVGHEYPYGESTCKAFQATAKGSAIYQSWVVTALVCYAAWKHAPRRASASTAADGAEAQHQHPHLLEPPEARKDVSSLVVGLDLVALLAAVGALSAPTAYLAKLVPGADGPLCEVGTLKAMAGHSPDSQLKAISVYYLIFSSALPFWIPMMVAIRPLRRLMAIKSNNVEVNISIATALSFFVFFLPHGLVVLVRHAADALGLVMSADHLWMVKIAQSLLLLVAYFWHFARPALLISLDPDLRPDVCTLGFYDSVGFKSTLEHVRVDFSAPDPTAGNSVSAVAVSIRDGQKQGCGGRVAADEGAALLCP